MRKALIITDHTNEQYYYESFLVPCEKRGVQVYVFDPSSFPSEASVSLALSTNGEVSGFIDVLRYESGAFLPERLDINDIDVAWHLRAGKPLPKRAGNELEANFAANESRSALDAVFANLNCSWINREQTIRFLESNKLYQQREAQRCGLSIPKTVIGNDPNRVIEFASKSQDLLLKTFTYTKLDDQGRHFIYSELFTADQLMSGENSIKECPVFAQEYVEKLYEYRVMAIGDRVLSCRIDSQASNATKVDWRHYDFKNVEHIQVNLPADTQRKLLCFMKRVGLKYGAIDLIETPGNDFVFLEVNPSGQWGWIEYYAGLPIPGAVAEMLATA